MADILLELNKLLCKFGAGKMTMTFYAALIDLEKGVMSVANAGHNFPILVPAKNAPERFSNKTSKFKFGRGQVTLSVPGTPLGLLADAKYEEFKVPIVAGDKVIFFTDGLIECKSPSGAMWGQKNFSKLIEKLRDIPGKEINSKIVEAAFDHFGNTPLADDVTVVTVEIPNQSTIDRKPTNEEKNIVSIDLSTDLDTQKSA
jgi:sigma-B regulation protein RsbU (phosphoserine phosphatase)